MKVQCPYRCDYCLNLKGQTNHWWLRPQDAEQFRLVRWDQQLADLDGYEHICSESCASKALSKWLANASGNLVRPTVFASETKAEFSAKPDFSKDMKPARALSAVQ
jgi:hypothetical protein